MPTRMEALPLFVVASLGAAVGLGGEWRTERESLAPAASPPLGAPEIAGALERAAPLLRNDEQDELEALYAARGGRALWLDGEELLPQAERLLTAIEELEGSGIDPEVYGVAELRRGLVVCGGESSAHPEIRLRQLADCEVALSRRLREVASDLDSGRVTPRSAGIAWHVEGGRRASPEALAQAVEDDRIGESLAALEPAHAGYRALRAARAELAAVEERGGWTRLPDTPGALRRDAEGVAKLRYRLVEAGDLAKDARDDEAAVKEALRRFQTRHGLATTGEADLTTLDALNVPAAARRRQVELNLERWRWLPEALGERYVEVNIPAYELELLERGEPTLSMRVVVGKPHQPTPAFSDEIEKLVLNPAWYVPSSIVENEILPAIEKDPDYLAKENMDVLGGEGRTLRVRQRPGPGNALGQVKFLLPNPWHVYLHDTPADRLFARRSRSLSHGCVRLERPLDLAEALLRGEPGWTRERIDEALASGETRAVALSSPVPVHLVYWTAWVDRDGALQFRSDPYEVDSKLARALVSI